MHRRHALSWALTGLAAAFMLLSAIPDVLRLPEAIAVFMHLGYPSYLLPFLGTAKLLGVATILVPGFARLKEWAFAGLVFDLLGAAYSHLSAGDPVTTWMIPVAALMLVAGAYLSFRFDGARARPAGIISPVGQSFQTSGSDHALTTRRLS